MSLLARLIVDKAIRWTSLRELAQAGSRFDRTVPAEEAASLAQEIVRAERTIERYQDASASA